MYKQPLSGTARRTHGVVVAEEFETEPLAAPAAMTEQRRSSVWVPGITSPKWSMAVVVLTTTAINIVFCALLIRDDPYEQIYAVREATVTAVAVCTGFSGVFGLIGAYKADRPSLILSFVFFLSTASTIRLDNRQADGDCKFQKRCLGQDDPPPWKPNHSTPNAYLYTGFGRATISQSQQSPSSPSR